MASDTLSGSEDVPLNHQTVVKPEAHMSFLAFAALPAVLFCNE